ncbi:MAG: thioredoxin domain-containing protein [Myxococcota bacterium]|nr:thioredoxin domain-containing protein [Myxococcota bacterium]
MLPLLMGGACEKKSSTTDTGAINAADRVDPAVANDTTPLAGIDLAKLESEKQKTFYKLVNSLKSPCGKTHSLRTSFSSDTSCKRAPFAVRYIVSLLDDEASEDQVREEFTHKYENTKTVKLDVSKAPRVGAEDAPIKLVEFFDYACPHCAQFKPMLDQVAQEQGSKISEHFMMYPLGKWPDSKSAAQAALAANKQGKFKEMHTLLFAKSPQHNKEAVMGYAKELGLDLAKFEADYGTAGAQVENDRAQGEAAGVESTPSLYFNDRKYSGPLNPKYIGMWIEEETAVNR